MENQNLETYLIISDNKFQIFLFDINNFKCLYDNELKIQNKIQNIDLSPLSKFLDYNIFQIEKLSGQFIKNIFCIIQDYNILNLNFSIKKKNYDKNISEKYLKNLLTEAKDLFKENYEEHIIMHIIINNYIINGKYFTSYPGDIESDHLCLDISFISINEQISDKIDKVLEKYQIKIKQYLCGNYIQNYFRDDNLALPEMICKIQSGLNSNEVSVVQKSIEKKGFFEKFFQLFS